MKSIALAYCIDNIRIAEEIERQLSRASYSFEHFYCKRTTNDESLSTQLRGKRGPVLLVISDNFLKSAQCMSGGLKFLQERGSDILPVIVDGQTKDDNTGQPISAPTQFDRVSDIIKYINYWQDQYLDLRKQKRQLHDELDEEKFNQYLRVMRDISGEIGEFLRTLRNMDFLEYPDFIANSYERFFRFTNDDNGWRAFRDLPPLMPIAPKPTFEPTAPVETLPPIVEIKQEIEVESHPNVEEPILEEKIAETPVAIVEEAEKMYEPEPSSNGNFEFEHIESKIEPPIEIEAAPEPEEKDLEEEPIGEAQIQNWVETAYDAANSGDVQSALSSLADYISFHPGSFALRYAYAVLLAQYTDNQSESINQLDAALEIEPENEEALLLIGQLAELKQDFLLAKNSYEKLVEINDENADAYYRLGMVVAAQYPDQIEQAAKYFKKAAKYDENNMDATYRYANLLAEQLDKPKKAIKYFEKTLKANPKHPFANYDLAMSYHRMGNKETAREYYLRAIKINPELKTPENDKAFEYKVTAYPESAATHETIEALKQSIQQLEEMLKTQEEEAAKQAEAAETLKAKLPGEGKIALITGATSGIGRTTATLLAENGFDLILTGRRKERLDDLEKELESEYDIKIKTLDFDVRDVNAVERAIENLGEDWQAIDILINNAGKAKGFHPIHEGKLEHWEEMIDTNVKGLLYMTRVVAPLMVKRRKGHIINISSTAGKEVYPNGNVYCASKFAVEALTKGMRLDLHSYNIRVSQVAPGHVEETEFALVRFDGDAERARIYEDFKPLNASDVADAILWAITRPPHVNVQDILLMGTQQAGVTIIDRSGRAIFEEEE
ncbi:MAG: SDR family NAD(P)-dependent oxidoreductase [Saprospiraceae bacterium]|nr:SDR family NAD(P)-dependent oxidoreductase [Saprospiraceae bacterium]